MTKSTHIQIRVEPELKELIRSKAKGQGLSISALLTNILLKMVKANDKP